MGKLLILGNGFDLSHGLKSDYNSFIDYLIHETCEGNLKLFPLIHGTSKTKSQLIQSIRKRDTQFLERAPNQFFTQALRRFSLENWCDVEELFFKLLNETPDEVRVKKLNSDFEEIKTLLSDYLTKEESNNKDVKLDSYQQFFNNFQTQFDIILNFNYTKTHERYLNEINQATIYNIHGELNNELNPMIFGYAANHSESRLLLDKNINSLMRNIKKHCYKETKNFDKMLLNLNYDHYIQCFTLGHSCGISDNLILNEIFNSKSIISITSLYYENRSNHFNSQVNIDRIMNDDKEFLSKFRSFEESIRIPQIKDGETQKIEFNLQINEALSK